MRVARALARTAARLVVLDEADRGLDPALREQVAAALADRFGAVTTITVTHDLEAAVNAQRVVLVEQGRISADGPPQQLLAEPDSAFARLVTEHRQLADHLSGAHGWGTAHLTEGGLRLTGPATGTATRAPAEDHPESSGLAESSVPDAANDHPGQRRGTDESTSPDGPPPQRLRHWVTPALLLAGVVALLSEWSSFLLGWSLVLDDPPRRWWPLLLALAGVAAGLAALTLGLAATRLGAALRTRLLHGCLDTPLERVRHAGAGDLLGRILEAFSFEQHLTAGGTDLLTGTAQLGAALAVAAGGAPVGVVALIGTWFCGLLAATMGATVSRGRWLTARVERTRVLLSRLRGHRTESVYGPPPLATDSISGAYHSRSLSSDRWRVLLLTNADLWLLVAVVAVLTFVPSTERLASLAALALAWGAFASLGVALDEIATATASARSFMTLTRAARPAAAAASLDPHRVDDPHQVRLSGVSDSHDGHRAVFENLDWTVAPGSRTVLSGRSGSGKSTLALVASGLRQPRQGKVSGHSGVVYVPQYGDNHVLQASFAFNLLLSRRWLPRDEDLSAASEVLGALGLGTLLDAMPRGMLQPVGEAGWRLSHGERARLHLARALLQGGHTIILDETLEGLDPTTARRALAAVDHHFESIILINHR